MNENQLRMTATAYPYLRGLVAVPAGLLWVLAALGNAGAGPFRYDLVFLATVVLIGAAALAIDRYYRAHFGRVTPSRRRQHRSAAAAVVGVVLMVGVSLLLRSRADWSLDLPVNPIPAAFGALMLAYYAAVVGLRAHHVIVWGGLALAGLLPVWTGADPSNIGLVMAGVATVVNGILDHVALVRMFGPPEAPGG
jgi:heme O synthase-like polyprenyltransferase